MNKTVLAIGIICLLIGVSVVSSTGIITEDVKSTYWPPPFGPNSGIPGEEYTFCIDLPDNPDCAPFYVMWDWGDGDTSDWFGPYGAGETVCANHSWNESGIYEIRVRIRDNCGNEYWSDTLVIIIGNNPPDTPVIEGKRRFKEGEGGEYPYKIYSIDPDDDDVCYYIKWSDGSSGWTSFYPSGEKITITVTIPMEEGTYEIFKIKARDPFGADSDWAILEVIVSRGKATYNSLLLRLIEQFPLLQKIFIFLPI